VPETARVLSIRTGRTEGAAPALFKNLRVETTAAALERARARWNRAQPRRWRLATLPPASFPRERDADWVTRPREQDGGRPPLLWSHRDTELEYSLEGLGIARLIGRVTARGRSECTLSLRVETSAGTTWEGDIEEGQQGPELDIDLTGAREMILSVDGDRRCYLSFNALYLTHERAAQP